MDEVLHLILNRLHHARRRMPQDVAAPAGEQVEIAFPLGVPDIRPFAMHKADGVANVIRDHIFLEQLDRLLAAGCRCGMHRVSPANVQGNSGRV